MQGFKMLLAAAAASTLAAAALPASAQSFDRGYGDHFGYGPPPPAYQPVFDRGPIDRGDLRAREDRLGEWIGNSARDGRIGGWQVRRLFDDLRSIRDEERSIRDRQYGRLYPDQAFRLNQRLDRLSDRVRDAQNFRAPPPPRWGW